MFNANDFVIAFLATDEGKRIINEKIGSAVKSAVDSALGYNSDFRKQLDAAVAGAMQLTSRIDLPSYNQSIITIATQMVEGMSKKAIQTQVAKRLENILQPVPEKIFLSELVEQYRLSLEEKAKE